MRLIPAKEWITRPPFVDGFGIEVQVVNREQAQSLIKQIQENVFDFIITNPPTFDLDTWPDHAEKLKRTLW